MMGDIADMVLDGVLDMHTGEYLGDGCGYPRTVEDFEDTENQKTRKVKIWQCTKCSRKFETDQARRQHYNKKHKNPKNMTCHCGAKLRGINALRQHKKDKGCA